MGYDEVEAGAMEELKFNGIHALRADLLDTIRDALENSADVAIKRASALTEELERRYNLGVGFADIVQAAFVRDINACIFHVAMGLTTERPYIDMPRSEVWREAWTILHRFLAFSYALSVGFAAKNSGMDDVTARRCMGLCVLCFKNPATLGQRLAALVQPQPPFLSRPVEVDDMEKLRPYLERAMTAGLVTDTGNGYKWNGTITLCAYFAEKLSKTFSPSSVFVDWGPFCRLFGYTQKQLQDGRGAYFRHGNVGPSRFERVDALFSD